MDLKKQYIICALVGFIIGTYDGFYGPGTGMLITFSFTVIAGFSILDTCGNTKLINFASNIAALVTFIINGNVIYKIGIPCATASIFGNIVGSSLAVKGGGKIVRPMMLLVLALLFIKVVVSLV